MPVEIMGRMFQIFTSPCNGRGVVWHRRSQTLSLNLNLRKSQNLNLRKSQNLNQRKSLMWKSLMWRWRREGRR
jgi:hypothetical protein